MTALSQTLRNGILALIFSLLFITASHASIQPPDKMIGEVTKTMLRSINENRAEIKQSPDKLKSLVEKIILPHLDFIAASKFVMGKYWRRAEKEQKIKFIRQFRLLLLRFYSSALAEFLSTNDKKLNEDLIKYFPIKVADGETSLTVRGEVKPDSGKSIPIFYRVHLTKKGWKIYDVSVEGISMITTYKNNFAAQFKTEGIDALIASLKEKNKEMLANNKHNKKTN